ncbi:hypothetical protein [Rhodohalobacter barkolensis]|uniref:Uncharacterized protein n=1 Tax=Rhodohalobacter barkolensis TaxID=2053187 RepID=A0A2N0VLT8_9BACT|nr:hypothetical protein [Rhodohalobacter barkolensis]PKD45165.1 hypothetical protein CWD77_06850 [Rhodohalobacter barkolensis]
MIGCSGFNYNLNQSPAEGVAVEHQSTVLTLVGFDGIVKLQGFAVSLLMHHPDLLHFVDFTIFSFESNRPDSAEHMTGWFSGHENEYFWRFKSTKDNINS